MPVDIDHARISDKLPFLITFSGIDGAGKTTQIELLASSLSQRGCRVLRLTFWDHVAVWSRMRAQVGQRTADSFAPDSSRPSFTPKNNKHIRTWYLSAARSGLYIFDLFRLRGLLASDDVRNSDVVIFDRYIYDQVANIYSSSLAARMYGHMLLNVTPAPNLAFLLDASPVAAFARKPEYPIEFMQQNRENFLRLRQLIPQLITIPAAAPEAVASQIFSHVDKSFFTRESLSPANTPVETKNGVVPRNNSRRAQNQPTANV